MDSARDLVLHIGLPKTGSTALQRRVFMRDPNIVYLGKFGRKENKWQANKLADRVVHELLCSNEQFWRTRGRELLEKLINAARPYTPANGPLLLSYEEILAHCFGGFRIISGRSRGGIVGLDSNALLRRLSALSTAWPGKVKVLMTVRRQDTFLASQFAQSFPELCDSQFNTFQRFIDGMIGESYYSIGGTVLDFDGFLAGLQGAVGEDAVDALIFEELQAAPEHVAESLERNIGVDRTRTITGLSERRPKVRALSDGQTWRVQQYRGSNVLQKTGTWAGRRLRGIPAIKHVTLSSELSSRVLGTWEDSNRRLSERLGRPLSPFGYTS